MQYSSANGGSEVMLSVYALFILVIFILVLPLICDNFRVVA